MGGGSSSGSSPPPAARVPKCSSFSVIVSCRWLPPENGSAAVVGTFCNFGNTLFPFPAARPGESRILAGALCRLTMDVSTESVLPLPPPNTLPHFDTFFGAADVVIVATLGPVEQEAWSSFCCLNTSGNTLGRPPSEESAPAPPEDGPPPPEIPSPLLSSAVAVPAPCCCCRPTTWLGARSFRNFVKIFRTSWSRCSSSCGSFFRFSASSFSRRTSATFRKISCKRTRFFVLVNDSY